VVSELHQPGQSFKLRGAFIFFKNLTRAQLKAEVGTASAGNHAQGIAYCSKLFEVKSHIVMPVNTPKHKITRVKEIGGDYVEPLLVGDDVDEALEYAKDYCKKTGAIFSAPFDDINVIAGQATLGIEIYQDLPNIDTVFCPVGGMGLIAGIAAAIKNRNPNVKIIGVEPEGAPSLQYARKIGKPSPLEGEIDTFVDGAAVRQVGEVPFEMTNHLIDDVISVSNTDLRQVITELWDIDKSYSWLVRSELAGGLALTGFRNYGSSSGSEATACIITGGSLSRERFESEVRISHPS
jgi:threonine dehydratase